MGLCRFCRTGRESMRSVCGTGLPYDPRRRWKKKALHKGYAVGMFLKDMGLCRLCRTGGERNGNAWRGCHYAPEATKTHGSGGWTALYHQGPWWHHRHRKSHRHKGKLDRRREDVDADEQGEEGKVFGKESRCHCISSSAKILNPDYLGHFFVLLGWMHCFYLLPPIPLCFDISHVVVSPHATIQSKCYAVNKL